MPPNRLTRETYTKGGLVYVVQDGDRYKIGFSRHREHRRARDAKGQLLFTIPAGNQPCTLERLLHKRFAGQRVTNHIRCEWFYLTPSDIAWLRGLADFLRENLP